MFQFFRKGRWLICGLFVIWALAYLNSAVFNFWAADVPPGLYPDEYRAIGTRHFLYSLVLLLLALVVPIALRKKKL